jgi:hypothetical protein
VKKYKFLRSFEPDEIDGIRGDGDEKEAHDVEVEGAPVVLEDHVGVSSDKHDQVQLLRFVGKTDDIFGRDDFEQE